MELDVDRRPQAQSAPADRTDGQLLDRFVARRDNAALAELIRRHGPLVLSVCRGILADEHDAEDAFQAVFLVFVRRAAALDQRGSLGSWLCGVAYRVALKARALAAKRRALEMKAQPPATPRSDSLDEAAGREVRQLVLEELNQLPEKYRAPLVLCYIQGRTHAEAAREMGMPRGSVAKRVAGALERLRKRLSGRGVALSTALAALAALNQSASAALPAPLADATLQSAARLTAGSSVRAVCSTQVSALVQLTLRSIFWAKVKGLMLAAFVVLLMGTGGMLTYYELIRPEPIGMPLPLPTEPSSPAPRSDPLPRALIAASDASLADDRPRIAVQLSQEKSRFGLRVHEPDQPDQFKRLTFPDEGLHNNSCLKIGEAEYLFGQAPGRWVRDEKTNQPLRNVPLEPGRCWMSAMEFGEGVRVTRFLRIIGGEQTRHLDTCLVVYVLENLGDKPMTVGFRELLDTFIGDNDGVPFAIPGKPGLVDSQAAFDRDDIPSYIQALERPDLTDPGTVAQLGLKVKDTEPMSRLVICHWPDEIGSDVRWKWDYRSMNAPLEKKDSCVVMYWPSLLLGPKGKKVVGYTYGLGRVSGAAGDIVADRRGQVGVTAGGAAEQDGIFTILAYVANSLDQQTVTLKLPEGLALVEDQKEVQQVLANIRFSYSPVSWRVKATRPGEHTIEVETRSATPKARPASVKHPVLIAPSSLFQ